MVQKEAACNLLPKNERNIQMKFPEGVKKQQMETRKIQIARIIADSFEINLQEIKRKKR